MRDTKDEHDSTGSRWKDAMSMGRADLRMELRAEAEHAVFVRMADGTIVAPGYIPEEIHVSGEWLRMLIEAHNELIAQREMQGERE